MSDSSYELFAGRPTIDKDVDADLVYGLDLTAWQEATGDVVTSATVSAAGTLTAGAASVGSGIVTARIGGGTLGQVMPVTFNWATAGGSSDSRTIWLRVVRR
jgi:hypothetical protein